MSDADRNGDGNIAKTYQDLSSAEHHAETVEKLLRSVEQKLDDFLTEHNITEENTIDQTNPSSNSNDQRNQQQGDDVDKKNDLGTSTK
ncbi:hypothetical protein EDC01DRAFT_670216 [Geopyxis carbonaria]|nr:hypothetical protein EDC01DRAFT_670216 [Geopyxis carbonaria]